MTSTPTMRSSSTKLVSSRDLADTTGQDADIIDAQSEVFEVDIEPDRYYVVLGDSLEGFYVVKCLSTNADCFHGKYFTRCSQNNEPRANGQKGDFF